MPAVQRVGDSNDAQAAIESGFNSVLVNGKAIAINGSKVARHGKSTHGGPVTANGITTVRANGIPVNVTGNQDNCGHARIGGSPDVRAGG
jgi:uncharacterized Zn-binding protein involved in type VI secretion